MDDQNIDAHLRVGTSMTEEQRASWLRRSFVVRHWRGELPLPVSYWINAFLGNIVVLLVAAAIIAAVTDYKPIPNLIAAAAIWFLVVLVATWQFVGVWRSANRHMAETKRFGWARVAKAVVVLGALRVTAEILGHGVPQLIEQTKIVFGDPTVGPHHLRLLRDGTEMEFSGGITFGTVGEIKTLLDSSPQIRVIHLDSQGGRVGEARHLAELVTARELVTYVSNQCISACTLVFLAGRERYVGAHAKLGFHSAGFPGIDADQIASENATDKRYMLGRGVAPAFADKVYSTPNSDLWFPPTDELFAAHVATQRATDDEFAISGIPQLPTADQLAAELDKYPAFAAIRQVEPRVFQGIMEEMRQGLAAGITMSDLQAKMRARIVPLIGKYAPVASSEALVEYMSTQIEEIRQIGGKDPDACYGYAVGGAPINLERYVSEDVRTRDSVSLGALISTGATNPQPVPPGSAIQQPVASVMQALRQKYDKDAELMGNLAAPGVDHTKACIILVAFYDEIMKLNEPDRANVLRLVMHGA